jgi:hypothetical protein
MSKKRIASIVLTVLFCIAVLPGAVMDILQPDMVLEIVEPLGIPLYMLTLIGIWKLLGIVGLAQPVSSRLREWATAGFFFDLTGAAWWHAGAGDMAGVAPPLVILSLLLGAYALRFSSEKA